MREEINIAIMTGDFKPLENSLQSIGLDLKSVVKLADDYRNLEVQRKNTRMGYEYDNMTNKLNNYMEEVIAPYLNKATLRKENVKTL